MTARDELTDQGKLLFGAGFVFGVTVTLCLLAVVLVAVTRVPASAGDIAASPLVLSVAGGVVFAGIVGAGLTYLAFDHNRAKIPVDPEQFGLDEE
jgi:hypothetical protein